MSNLYIDYYSKQIGHGIPGCRGLRYQKGYGLLSSLFSKAIFPLFETVASKINPASVLSVASDVLKSPGLSYGKPLADDLARMGATATGALLNQLQKGSGKRRKYKRCVKPKRSSLSKRKSKRKVPQLKRRLCKRRNKRSRRRTQCKKKLCKRTKVRHKRDAWS